MRSILNRVNRKIKLLLPSLLGTSTAIALLTAFQNKVYAVCPVCTVAVGAGLGISRWLGIDDSVVGVWIGGLTVSGGFWFSSAVLSKKNVPAPKLISVALFAAVIYSILHLANFLGLPGNTIVGVDKIIFGALIGMIVFQMSALVDNMLRRSNNEKVYIYYQKVLLPMSFLSITSYIMYLLTT